MFCIFETTGTSDTRDTTRSLLFDYHLIVFRMCNHSREPNPSLDSDVQLKLKNTQLHRNADQTVWKYCTRFLHRIYIVGAWLTESIYRSANSPLWQHFTANLAILLYYKRAARRYHSTIITLSNCRCNKPNANPHCRKILWKGMAFLIQYYFPRLLPDKYCGINVV